MLVRITAQRGHSRIPGERAKADKFTRDELDERVILDGDLELTDTIIKGMEKEGERYLYSNACLQRGCLRPRSDARACERLQTICNERLRCRRIQLLRRGAFTETQELHQPANRGIMERKPHIHIVIPEQNLLSGQNPQPVWSSGAANEIPEAFQEHANAKYGLASPKDNRRTEFTSESEIISRYKGDLFQGSAKGTERAHLVGCSRPANIGLRQLQSFIDRVRRDPQPQRGQGHRIPET